MQNAESHNTALVVLAGGKSSRMQSLEGASRSALQELSKDARKETQIDKAHLEIDGRSFLRLTLKSLEHNPFRARAINSNAPPETFRDLVEDFRLEIFSDAEKERHQGPLAGILAAMRWSLRKESAWLLTVPCDCPFLPKDLWHKLRERQQNTAADIVCAESNARRHPVVALWRTSLKDNLEQALREGTRKIDRWTEQHNTKSQVWSQTPDPFFNINRPEDLIQAELRAQKTRLDQDSTKLDEQDSAG